MSLMSDKAEVHRATSLQDFSEVSRDWFHELTDVLNPIVYVRPDAGSCLSALVESKGGPIFHIIRSLGH